MKSATTIIVVLGLILLAGCKSQKNEPAPTAPVPAAPPTVAEINAAKLSEALVPQAVQTAFARDYPKAAIDNITLRSTSTGLSFYQITFISQGQPGVGSYYATGAKAP